MISLTEVEAVAALEELPSSAIHILPCPSNELQNESSISENPFRRKKNSSCMDTEDQSDRLQEFFHVTDYMKEKMEIPNPPRNKYHRFPKKKHAQLRGIVLVLVAATSTFAMERFARPHSRPSASLFMTAIMLYSSAVGIYYYIHSNERFLHPSMVGGGALGLGIGLIIGFDFPQILFRLLPGALLVSILIGSYCSRNMRA